MAGKGWLISYCVSVNYLGGNYGTEQRSLVIQARWDRHPPLWRMSSSWNHQLSHLDFAIDTSSSSLSTPWGNWVGEEPYLPQNSQILYFKILEVPKVVLGNSESGSFFCHSYEFMKAIHSVSNVKSDECTHAVEKEDEILYSFSSKGANCTTNSYFHGNFKSSEEELSKGRSPYVLTLSIVLQKNSDPIGVIWYWSTSWFLLLLIGYLCQSYISQPRWQRRSVTQLGVTWWWSTGVSFMIWKP